MLFKLRKVTGKIWIVGSVRQVVGELELLGAVLGFGTCVPWTKTVYLRPQFPQSVIILGLVDRVSISKKLDVYHPAPDTKDNHYAIRSQ